MKLREIREMSDDALRAELNDKKEELMKLRFQQASGELQDFTRLRLMRREIARLYTIMRERQQNPDSEVSNE
jgi:large subunit ribosomal protein L29